MVFSAVLRHCVRTKAKTEGVPARGLDRDREARRVFVMKKITLKISALGFLFAAANLSLSSCGGEEVVEDKPTAEDAADQEPITQEIASKQAALDVSVIFKDANLQSAARKAIDNPEGGVTRKDLASLEKLTGVQHGITDLTGIEQAANLTLLDLNTNQITDVKPLAGLTKLTSLFLGGNQIVDVKPLTGLTELPHLDLHSNQITDITPLAELTNLTLLDLSNNQITDGQKEMLSKALPNCDIMF